MYVGVVSLAAPWFGREVIVSVVDMAALGTAFGYGYTCLAAAHVACTRLALHAAGIAFDPFDAISASLAAHRWRRYRRQGGRRTRVIADFLVAAHAETRAQALLTRDRGFYRRHFETLRVVEPQRSAS